MQQKPAWKAPPCVASLCTHINCGNQLLSLVDSAHGTEAQMYSEYIYFPPPLVIYKVLTITVNQCDNTRLKIFIPSDADKPMASGASHDTSVLQ